jgi:hypothetical protein
LLKTIDLLGIVKELQYNNNMTDYQNRIDQARAEFEAARASFKAVNTDEAKQQVDRTYDVWFDITNEHKLAEAKEKAAEIWAVWSTANKTARAAFFAYRKAAATGGNEADCWKKYEEACATREDAYAFAIEANEEVWRFESLTVES